MMLDNRWEADCYLDRHCMKISGTVSLVLAVEWFFGHFPVPHTRYQVHCTCSYSIYDRE